MTLLRLRLLGSPELVCGGQQAAFKTRKALALLAYLAVEQGVHAREEVADLLWPSGGAENARSSLRTTIRYLRSALADAADAVVIATRDSLGLAPSASLDIDVELLRHVRRQIRSPGDSQRVPGGLRDEVEQAISVYRGQFLGDLSVPDAPEFDAWLAEQRAHWLGVVSELLDYLSTVQTEAGDINAALLTLERWALLDPAEEVAWQRMIELHLAQGNRVAARQAWGSYRRALENLDIEASVQLEALRTQIDGSHRAGTATLSVGASSAPHEMDLVRMPFVGRAGELMQLRRAFEQARGGAPQVVVLEGEAGIGKTRLGEEFLAWAAIQGADMLRSRGFETTVDLPFATLIEALRSRLERENAPDDLLDDPWLAEVSRLLPELRARYPDLPPATSDPVLRRNQLFEAVTRLGKGLAERHPLVVFRDDWHWSDAGSRDLLRYALRRWSNDHDRVMVLLTVSVEQIRKDRALAQWMGSLERDAPTTRLGLERLTEPDVLLWMAALAGTSGEGSFTDAAATRLGGWLMEQAVGNPSRIVATIQSLLDQQVLSFRKCEEGTWALDLIGLPRLSAALPADVTGVPTRQQHWGDAPDARLLYGRREELEELERWVVTDECREVALLGIGGIGKTALAARLAQKAAPHFEFVFWRSLRNALPFDEWVTDAIHVLSEQHQVTLPESQEERILLVLDLLRAHRCLLVLDNLETVLEPGTRQTAYLEGYAPYGLLMQRLGTVDHRSCLLVTSREKPLEVALLEGKESVVRTFQLTGLGAAAGRAFLDRERLEGDDAAWRALVERYAGNPLALQVAGETIGEVFAGEIPAFLREGEAVYGGIRRVLDAQFDRLSPLEQAILSWLAIEREPVGFIDLYRDLEPPAPRGDVLEALESLRHRSLLERRSQGGGFTLQPVVLEYVTNRLVSGAVQEIRDGDLGLLSSHVLSKAQSKSYVRQSQERLIVAPILDRLSALYGSEDEVEGRLLELVDQVRCQNRRDYAPGNVVNLLHQLRGNLHGLDLSHLFIRQVYLQEADAQDANLSESHLVECALAEAFDSCISVTFSPDGRYFAAGTFNGEVCVWRTADRTRLVAMQGHAGVVWGIDWASDGQFFASGGLDGTVKLWEAQSGKLLKILAGHTGSVLRVSVSTDCQLIASSSLDGTVKLWDTRTGRLLHTLRGHAGAAWGVAVSTDGSTVASSSTDGTVKLWEMGSGSLLTTLEGHGGSLHDVIFTTDGRLVATAGQDGLIRLWEVMTGNLISILQGHTHEVWRLAMSADGQLLASSSQDGTVRLWEVASGACLAAVEAHTGVVFDVAISPDAHRCASASQDGTVRLWEIPSAKLVTTLKGYARGAWGLAWDGTGRFLANGTQDGTINLWDVPSDVLRATLHGHTGLVFATALSHDGQLLVSGSEDSTIRFWRVADGVCLRTVEAHPGGAYSVVLSPDARLLVSSGQDGLIKLWDVSSGDLRVTLQAHTGLVWSLALSADGHLLVSGSQDGTVKLWEIPGGRLLATMRDNDDLFWGVALSGDGNLVASGGQSGRVTLWDAPSGKVLATLGAHDGPVWGMAVSQDARLVVSGSLDGTVLLWDVATRQLIARCTGHIGPINDVAVSPDGSLIASSSQDGAVMLWDCESGALRGTLRPDRRYERMDITGLAGVSDVQKTVLKTLGAVERTP